jgi:hypothetical protein
VHFRGYADSQTVSFWTCSHELFTYYYYQFYAGGSKKVLKIIFDTLTAGARKDRGYILCTNRFTREYTSILICVLKTKFGFECYVRLVGKLYKGVICIKI